MFSGVTSSARSPSHTKMMTLRGAHPPCCGVAGPPPSARTTNDKTIRTMNLFAFTRMAEAQLRWSSLNDLIRPQQHRPRDRQPERPGGLQVDDELELRGLLPWKIIGLGALQNLVHVGGRPPKQPGEILPVRHEAVRVSVTSRSGPEAACTSTAIRRARGSMSLSNASRLAFSSVLRNDWPVMLSAGLARLLVKPEATASLVAATTIGIVGLARRTARTATPVVTMTSGLSATSSSASPWIRSGRP